MTSSASRKTLLQFGSLLLLAPFLAAPASDRSYVGGRFALELDGASVGYLKSVEGGNAVQSPITRGTRADKYPDKSPGTVRYEDAIIEVPLTAPANLWNWVNAASSPAGAAPKQASLILADFNLVEKSRRIWDEATLSGVEFPALDGSSKDVGYLKLTLSPGRTRDVATKSGAKPAADSTKTKNFITANFRLTIDGLATNRVSKIDAITIRHPAKGGLEYSNLVVTVPDVDIDGWKAWANQTLGGKSVEKSGKIDLLAPNMSDVMLTVGLEGLGVVRVAPDKLEANSDTIRRTKVELYVEKITFSPGK